MFPFMTCILYLSCPPLSYYNREKNLFSSCETQRVAENRFDFCVIATSEFQRPVNSISFTKSTQINATLYSTTLYSTKHFVLTYQVMCQPL